MQAKKIARREAMAAKKAAKAALPKPVLAKAATWKRLSGQTLLSFRPPVLVPREEALEVSSGEESDPASTPSHTPIGSSDDEEMSPLTPELPSPQLTRSRRKASCPRRSQRWLLQRLARWWISSRWRKAQALVWRATLFPQ